MRASDQQQRKLLEMWQLRVLQRFERHHLRELQAGGPSRTLGDWRLSRQFNRKRDVEESEMSQLIRQGHREMKTASLVCFFRSMNQSHKKTDWFGRTPLEFVFNAADLVLGLAVAQNFSKRFLQSDS